MHSTVDPDGPRWGTTKSGEERTIRISPKMIAALKAYRKLQPQANYASIAEHVVYDPPAWYSGSGSALEVEAGSAFGSVMGGRSSPAQGVAQFRAGLDRLASAPSPV